MPVFVILDWDAEGNVDSIRKIFSADDPLIVLAWPSSAFNPKLNGTFHGVERHFSDRVIREGEKKGARIFRDDTGVCSVDRDEYGQIKKALNQVVREGLEMNDLEYAAEFIKEIVQEIDEYM